MFIGFTGPAGVSRVYLGFNLFGIYRTYRACGGFVGLNRYRV